jgi:dienelactone hydrolase
MKKYFLIALAVALSLPACMSKSTSTVETSPTATFVFTPASPFDYDASIPLDIKIASETERDGVTVVDLSYAAHAPAFSPMTGGRMLAYLVRPKGNGPFAGILYLHFPGTRAQYMDEAVRMAQQGAVCLLLQGYFPWLTVPLGTEADHPLIVGQVIELRRAVDFLLTQPGVDPARLGFVGFDYGAMYAGILAGIDHRLKAYTLIAGTPTFAEENELGFLQIHAETYAPLVRDLDPIRFISQAAPAALFFQFGNQDGTLPREQAVAYYEAASQPKNVEWYDDIHDMNNPATVAARLVWLAGQLGLDTTR